MTSIGSSAFDGCSGLTSVTFGEGSRLESIGSNAFDGCSGLTSVEIPSSVTSIGYSFGSYAFDGCSGLTSVTFEEGSRLESIYSSTFRGCSGLTSVEIPSSVTRIGSDAFYGCSGLTSVEIPSSVTRIGSYAFSGCSGLTSVTFGDISGWYVDGSENNIGSTAVRLSATDLAVNAELVRNTYDHYDWYKMD